MKVSTHYSETGNLGSMKRTNSSVKDMVDGRECFVDVCKSSIEVLDASFNTVFVYLRDTMTRRGTYFPYPHTRGFNCSD